MRQHGGRLIFVAFGDLELAPGARVAGRIIEPVLSPPLWITIQLKVRSRYRLVLCQARLSQLH